MPKDGHKIYLRNKLKEYADRESGLVQRASKYADFYDDARDEDLRTAFAIFHEQFNNLLGYLNLRIQKGHYTAHESRELLYWIDEVWQMQTNLRGTDDEFEMVPYYETVLGTCQSFLQSSGGSPIPDEMERIALVEGQPIFNLKTAAVVERHGRRSLFPTTLVGSGSYASVHKYYDEHYHRFFAIKRANKDLTNVEFKRFRTEFEIMKKLNSPYVIEVYDFDEGNRQYTMEYADKTLKEYIAANNNSLKFTDRVALVRQFFRAFKYIHSKGVLHRDIGISNVLLKIYDGVTVIKVSDFGLVKLPESTLTRSDTEMKGHLNDPKLSLVGFNRYTMQHETYALVRLVYFIMTGRMQISDFSHPAYRAFVSKGLSDNLQDRYADVKGMQSAFEAVLQSMSAEH